MTPEQERKSELAKFWQALQNDDPLDPGKPEDAKLYVRELHSGKSEVGPVDDLATQIRLSSGSRVWLFAGNIGSGKSTELNRLRSDLQNDENCVALLADAGDYINLTELVTIGDFLLSLTAAFADQAGKFLNKDLLICGFGERINNFLLNTHVEADSASLGATAKTGALDLKADIRVQIKTDPVIKQRVSAVLAARPSAFYEALEAFHSAILQELRALKGEHVKVVFIFDSLEKFRGGENEAVFTSVRAMFRDFAQRLWLKDIQVVYSVAPYLLSLEPQLAGLYGAVAVCYLTSAHVFNARDGKLDMAGGVAHLISIIERRYPHWERYLDRPILVSVIENSGGDLRDFFRLLGLVILRLQNSTDQQKALSFACEHMRRSLTLITEAEKSRYRLIAQSRKALLENETDRLALVRDIETKRVLVYFNDSQWYDVHPLLRDSIGASEK